jgi:hypothetical protein
MDRIQKLRAEAYAAGRADQSPAGLYVHHAKFVAAVADGATGAPFRPLYDRLLLETHGPRAFATNSKAPGADTKEPTPVFTALVLPEDVEEVKGEL